MTSKHSTCGDSMESIIPISNVLAGMELCAMLGWHNTHLVESKAGSIVIHSNLGKPGTDFVVTLDPTGSATVACSWPIQPVISAFENRAVSFELDVESGEGRLSAQSWAEVSAHIIQLTFDKNRTTIWEQILSVQSTVHTINPRHTICGSDCHSVRVALDDACTVTLDWLPVASSAKAGSKTERLLASPSKIRRTAHIISPGQLSEYNSSQSSCDSGAAADKCEPHAVCPQFVFWGPPSSCRKWQEKLEAFFRHGTSVWQQYPSSGDALVAALGIPRLAPKANAAQALSQANTADADTTAAQTRVECAVCWMVDCPCTLPEGAGAQWTFCTAAACARPFHVACLREALLVEAGTTRRAGELHGACPFCGAGVAVVE